MNKLNPSQLRERAQQIRVSALRAETTTQRLEELGEAIRLEQMANQGFSDSDYQPVLSVPPVIQIKEADLIDFSAEHLALFGTNRQI